MVTLRSQILGLPCLTNGFNQPARIQLSIREFGANGSHGCDSLNPSQLSDRPSSCEVFALIHTILLGRSGGIAGNKSVDFAEISATSCVLRSRHSKACAR